MEQLIAELLKDKDIKETLKRIDVSNLYPLFLYKLLLVIKGCNKRGIYLIITEALRTPKRQAELYAIGRTALGNKVTNAQPYESYHQYGLAVDFVIDGDIIKSGLQPDWNIKSYKVLQEECHKQGLRSGLDFKSFPEAPHVEFPTEVSLKELEQVLKQHNSLQKVWELL